MATRRKNRLVCHPAIHRNVEYYLDLDNKADAQTKLFISSAEKDDDRFKKPLKKWLKHWKYYKKWQFKLDKIKEHNHFSAAPIAFRNGMKWLFKEN